jgi:hypothetical protein
MAEITSSQLVRSPPARGILQDIELARISQRVLGCGRDAHYWTPPAQVRAFSFPNTAPTKLSLATFGPGTHPAQVRVAIRVSNFVQTRAVNGQRLRSYGDVKHKASRTNS